MRFLPSQSKFTNMPTIKDILILLQENLSLGCVNRCDIDILHSAKLALILCRELITKVLIRLSLCAGWSAPLLFV